MRLTDPAQVSLNTHGFCLFRESLPGEVLRELRAELDEAEGLNGAGSRELADVLPDTVARLDQHLQANCLRPHISDRWFCVRVLFFDKTPESNWPVLWHQDLTIQVQKKHDLEGFGPWSIKHKRHHVQPPADTLDRMISLRVHLDDAEKDNGGLRVIPGSHRHGVIREHEIQAQKSGHAAVDCEARAGDVLAIKPLLLHASRRSENPGHRRVIHMEYAAENLPPPLEWGMDSRLGFL